MDNVSRPLIALLLGSVAFFAIWLLALKPSPSAGGGTKPGVGQYQSAIDKAHQAVGTSNAASQAHGGTVATTPAASTTPTTSTTAGSIAAAATQSASASTTTPATSATTATPNGRLNMVQQALSAHKVLALLFYNPLATDDRAVKQELSSVPDYGGSVVKIAVPIAEISSYALVSSQVQVSSSPTLVIVNRAQQAKQIAGFADRFEIAQRVSDALAVP